MLTTPRLTARRRRIRRHDVSNHANHRPGCRSPPVRGVGVGGARDSRHDAEHRPAAPVHARCAPAGRQGRRGTRLRREAGHRLHAPGLREAGRGPQLRPDHDDRQPDRLGVRLRQRDPVRGRRREADGTRGSRAGAVHHGSSSPRWLGSARISSSWPRTRWSWVPPPRCSSHFANESGSSTSSKVSPAAVSTPTSTASAG